MNLATPRTLLCAVAIMRLPALPLPRPRQDGAAAYGPSQVERQCLQQADGADLFAAVHRKARHATVLDDAVRPFGQLAPPVGFLAFLARHSRPPFLDRRWLVAASPAPLAQRLGGDRGALRRRRSVDRHAGITLRQFDDVFL